MKARRLGFGNADVIGKGACGVYWGGGRRGSEEKVLMFEIILVKVKAWHN